MMITKRPQSRRVIGFALLIPLAFWLGTCVHSQTAARAEVRRSPTPQAFLSGGERSLPILREISATLKQMDARLAKIEKVALADPK